MPLLSSSNIELMTPKSQFKEMKRIGMTEQELENLLVKYAIESEKAHLS